MADSNKKDKLIKVQVRWNAILCLILDDEDGTNCTTRAMAKRLEEDYKIKVDHVTVWNDYNDETFKTKVRQALLSKFQTTTLVKAAHNVNKAIFDGGLDPSEKVLDKIGFYPPPEMIIHSRMEAPGDTEEKALLEMLTSEGGLEQLQAKLSELKDMPDEDPEPETEPDS